MMYPELFKLFFRPYVCPVNRTIVIGHSEKELGIVNESKARHVIM